MNIPPTQLAEYSISEIKMIIKTFDLSEHETIAVRTIMRMVRKGKLIRE